MGQIWGAARREEGYRLGANEPWLVWGVEIVRWFVHYNLGRPVFGSRKSNATWSENGTMLYREGSPAMRKPVFWDTHPQWCWARLTERKRAAIRHGLHVWLIAVGWGWWDGSPFGSPMHDLFTVAGAMVTWWLLYRVTASVDTRVRGRRKRTLMDPLKSALAPVLGESVQGMRLNMKKGDLA